MRGAGTRTPAPEWPSEWPLTGKLGGDPGWLLLAYSVEKLVSPSGAGTAAKFDLIECPLLNATRPGDGL